MADNVNLDSTYRRRQRLLEEQELESFVNPSEDEDVAAPALADVPGNQPHPAAELESFTNPPPMSAPPPASAGQEGAPFTTSLSLTDPRAPTEQTDIAGMPIGIGEMTVQDLLTLPFPGGDLLLPAAQGVRDALVVAGQNINAMGNWMREHGIGPRGQLMIHLPDFDKPDNVLESLTTTTAQFLAGFLPAMKYTKWLGITGAVARPTVAGVLADMAVMDPTQPQVADLIVKLAPALRNPVLTYLQSDPTDTRAEQIFKQATQGALTGALFDGLFFTVRSMRTALHARRAASASGDKAIVDAATTTRSDVIANADVEPSIVAVREADGFVDVSRPVNPDLAPPPNDLDPTSPFLLPEGAQTPAPPVAPIERSAAADVAEEVVEDVVPAFPRARDLPEDLPGVTFPRRTMASQFEPRPMKFKNLADTPDEMLEFKRFVVKHGGIKLEGEELAGELGALIRIREGAQARLMNNKSGLTLQAMADKAQEAGFARSADKAEVLDLLDRSVRQGQDVLSFHNPGLLFETLNSDPVQAAMYYKLKSLAENWDNLKEVARRGTIPRAQSHAMGESLRETGEISLSYIRDLAPGTPVNAEQASAIVSLHTELLELAQKHAQDFMREPLDATFNKIVDLLNMFGEADPSRFGMMAESGRSLGIFNDPLSGFKTYMAQFDALVKDTPHMSKLRLAEQVASFKSVQELADAAKQARRQSKAGNGSAIAQQLTTEQVDTLQRAATDAAAILDLPPPAFTGQAISGEQLQMIRQAQEAVTAPGFTGEAIDQAQMDLLREAEALVDIPAFGGQSMTAEQLALIEGAMTAEELGRAPLKDVWMELWYNSMLSGPAGRVADVVSMGLTTSWAIQERFFATAFTNDIGTREALELAHGAFEGFGDALRLSRRAFTTGQRQFGRKTVIRPDGQAVHVLPATRIEGEAAQATGRQAISAEGMQATGMLGHAIDYLGNAINLPRRSMLASDEFFRVVNYRMELRAQAYRQARNEVRAGVLDPEELGNRMGHLSLNPTPEIADAATNFAYYNTFTTALTQKGAAFEMAGKATQFFSMGVQAHPVFQVVMPFIKTPFNLTRFAAERTPLGAFSWNILRDMAGTNGGAARGLAMAKMGLGTMLLGTAGLLTQQRLLTGHGPDNSRLRFRLMSTNKWKPYSLKLGDTWVAYNRFDPFGMMLGGAADITALFGEVDEMDAARLSGGLLQVMWDNLGSKTYLRQASELFDALKGQSWDTGAQIGQRSQRFMQRFVGNLLVPSVVAGAARVIDPIRRDLGGKGVGFFDSLVRGVQARTPGWSQSLPARRNFWGEEQLLGMGWHDAVRNPLMSFLLPVFVGDASPLEPADHAMLALGYLPPMPERAFKSPGQPPIELSGEEYDRYQLLSAGHGLPGPSLRDALNSYVTSDRYRAQNNFQRVSTMREVIFADLQSTQGYRVRGKKQLLREFPALEKRLDEQHKAAQGVRRERGGVPTPELPLSIGIR